MERWKTMLGLKAEISKAIELARQNKTIGHSLDASVHISPPDHLYSLLDAHCEDMRALLIVSQVTVTKDKLMENAYESSEFPGLQVKVAKASGQKCNRCWMYSTSVGTDASHPAICNKCLIDIS